MHTDDPLALRLSILDFGLRRYDAPSRLAAAETLRAAQLAEQLGYHRYWLAEHQAFENAWGAAAPMVAHLAAHTRAMRIGAAGTLAAFRDPFDTAQDYRLLACLYGDRIDLGIAGGLPSNAGLVARHRARGDLRERYERHVRELIGFARAHADVADIEAGRLVPLPGDVTVPTPWMLGSGGGSRDLALAHGTAYCLSLLHGARRPDAAVMREYLARFAPGPHGAAPQAAIAVGVVCAESEREAVAIAQRRGPDLAARSIQLNVVGSAAQCAARLRACAAEYGVGEVVVLDLSCTVPERRRCYALLAAELLAPPAGARAGAHAAPQDLA